jgi:lambda repressor-like predicted transcriptional regulator
MTLGDMKITDQLAEVRAELERRKGSLRQVAEESGLSYDTVLRIKNEPDSVPSYDKVLTLMRYLRGVKAAA